MVGYIGDTAQFHQIFFCKKIHAEPHMIGIFIVKTATLAAATVGYLDRRVAGSGVVGFDPTRAL